MKNKKVLILSIVCILVVVVILGILYFTTDLFKTEQQLFYKYLSHTKVINYDFFKQFYTLNNMISKESNSSTATMNISTLTPNFETGVVDAQEILSVKSNGLENVLSNQSYRDFTISNGEQNVLTLRYMRDDNVYAIGADNILAKYLAVENNNLKELAIKFGIENTEKIPNSIPNNLYKILKIDEETKIKLSQTYLSIIYNNIDETHFYKTVNKDGTENIGIILTENEINNLIILILETAKSDNVLLNLIIDKANLLGQSEVTIENIQTELQNYVDKIKKDKSTSTTEDDGWKMSNINEYEKITNRVIKISLIKKHKEIIAINFENNYTRQVKKCESLMSKNFQLVEENLVNTVYMDFSEDDNIDVFIKENDVEIGKFNINYSKDISDLKLIITMEIKEDDEIKTIKVQYQNSNLQTDNIKQKCVIEAHNNEEKYQIDFTNDISFKQDVIISKLTTENSVKINDMTSEEISQLTIALINRIIMLYGEGIVQNFK